MAETNQRKFTPEWFDNLTSDNIERLDKELAKKPEDRDEKLKNVVSKYEQHLDAKQYFTQLKENKNRVGVNDKGEKSFLDALGSTARVAGQGLTFGFGDEIEAGVRSKISGTDYTDELQKSRGEIDKFKAQFPKLGFANELAGGLLGGGTILKGANALKNKITYNPLKKGINLLTGQGGASLLSKIGRQVPIGVLAGGTYGAGTGTEGNRGLNAAMQGAIGGIASPLVYGGGSAAVNTIGKFRQGLSNKLEDPAVINQLNKYDNVKDLGGIDEIQTNIKAGDPMILQGQTAANVKSDLQGFPEADNAVKKYLYGVRDARVSQAYDNIIDGLDGQPIKRLDDETATAYQQRISDENFNTANKNYEAAQLNNPISDEQSKKILDIQKKIQWSVLPDGIRKDIEAYVDVNNFKPFSFDKSGKLTINKKILTEADLEELQKSLGGFEKVGTNILKAKKTLQTDIKDILNDNAQLTTARNTFKKASEIKDAYEEAVSLFNTNRVAEFTDFLNRVSKNATQASEDDIMDAVRRAAIRNIDKKTTSSDAITRYIKKINDENSAEYKLLDLVFPDGNFVNIIDDVAKANRGIKATGQYTGGSDTSKNILKVADTGNQVANALLNPVSTTVKKLTKTELTSQQANRVAEILTSENPNIINRINDPKYAKLFSDKINAIIPNLSSYAAPVTSAVTTNQFLQ